MVAGREHLAQGSLELPGVHGVNCIAVPPRLRSRPPASTGPGDRLCGDFLLPPRPRWYKVRKFDFSKTRVESPEAAMPVISMFYGVIVRMFFFDTDRHKYPHIHV